MASHQLAIAKASFSAGLLRPDPTSLSREDIAHFHSLLNSTILQCSPRNVQKCKKWILENIVQSTARFTALGKYLTALASSFNERGHLNPTAKHEPSNKRKRLHILYIANDLLYNAKYRVSDASICGKLQPFLMGLLGSAASFTGCPRHNQKIVSLLALWEENGYYSKDYMDKLREAVKNASELGNHEEGAGKASQSEDQDSKTKSSKSAPFVMPAMHGDASMPWFDLPAGNLMPHIIPNSTRPINPSMIRPLQFVAGPADEGLVLAVKDLLDDAQKIFEGETDEAGDTVWDIDELGQPIVLDEITGDVLEGEGYYGWSRSFCEKMKRRRKGLDMPDRDRSPDRSSSPSRKKRRYSGSDGSSSPAGHRSSHARRYSSSRSPSSSPRPGFSRLRSRSRSYSRSPPRSSDSPRRANLELPETRPAPPPPQELSQKPAAHFNQNMPFQRGFNPNIPPPPPPPPAPNVLYNGTQPHFSSWPPPPPPPPAPNVQYNGTQHFNSWPPPPPPAPAGPGNFQQHMGGYTPPSGPGNFQQIPGGFTPPAGPGGWQPPLQPNNGRGYNNGGWNNASQGRGGRGNYRGRGW